MLFNSLPFVLFFLCFYFLYRTSRRSWRVQNWLFLAANYIFYAYWDWRFLGLIALTTVVDYTVGLKIEATEEPRFRKIWLLVSLTTNIGVLAFFKYFNFFVGSMVDLLRVFGMQADDVTLKIVLPVGISFYIFQSLSYTIDVYKKRMPAVSFLPDYAMFVSMFPQLLSGPIARAKVMIPQIQAPREIRADQINAAIWLILWGYFKKAYVADNIAKTANLVFDNYSKFQGLDLLMGVLAFAVQIYADFSGYSDLARGFAKLLGFELPLNFRLPYFSLGPADFWTRWNISLSQWLRDYVFWPLMTTKAILIPGGRTTEIHTYQNMLLTMLIGGLWHGASWNFVFWGGYYGILLIIYRLIEPEPSGKNPWKQDRAWMKLVPRMVVMFALTLIGWIFFRCVTPAQIVHFLTAGGIGTSPQTFTLLRDLIFFSFPVVFIQIWQYRKANLLAPSALPLVPRIALYSLIAIGIFVFGIREHTEFIYFNF